jgi:hypothetical protein
MSLWSKYYYLLTENINIFPMRDWHVKHMQDTIVKYLTGLSENASRFERRLNKKYGGLINVRKRIDYDVKHGVTRQKVIVFFRRVRTDPLFSELRKNDGFEDRLYQLESNFGLTESQAKSSALFDDF